MEIKDSEDGMEMCIKQGDLERVFQRIRPRSHLEGEIVRTVVGFLDSHCIQTYSMNFGDVDILSFAKSQGLYEKAIKYLEAGGELLIGPKKLQSRFRFFPEMGYQMSYPMKGRMFEVESLPDYLWRNNFLGYPDSADSRKYRLTPILSLFERLTSKKPNPINLVIVSEDVPLRFLHERDRERGILYTSYYDIVPYDTGAYCYPELISVEGD